MDAGEDREYSRQPRPEDLVTICAALNGEGARYILIGGFAVIARGLERPTKDIDLLVDSTPENIERIKRALAVLPDNAARSEVIAHPRSAGRRCELPMHGWVVIE